MVVFCCELLIACLFLQVSCYRCCNYALFCDLCSLQVSSRGNSYLPTRSQCWCSVAGFI